MPGVDRDGVRQLREPVQAVEEVARALAGRDGEVGARRVADEERVPGEQDPLVDEKAAVLGPVAGGVQHADPDRAELELLAVGERLVRILDRRDRVDVDGQAVLEREPPVTGEVIGVRVRLEHGDQADSRSGSASSRYCSIA